MLSFYVGQKSQVLEKQIQIAEIEEQEKATEVDSKSTFQIPIKRESPFPKLQSPSQTGHGLDMSFNSNELHRIGL